MEVRLQSCSWSYCRNVHDIPTRRHPTEGRLKFCSISLQRSMWRVTHVGPVTPSCRRTPDCSSFSVRPVALAVLSPPSRLASRLSLGSVLPFEPKLPKPHTHTPAVFSTLSVCAQFLFHCSVLFLCLFIEPFFCCLCICWDGACQLFLWQTTCYENESVRIYNMYKGCSRPCHL